MKWPIFRPKAQPPARCCDCKWMVGQYGWRPTNEYHEGTCHRHAPIGLNDNGMGTPNVALWPHVRGGDGCGDFELFPAQFRDKEKS